MNRRVHLNSAAAAIYIADIENPIGASWGTDDTILFGRPEGVMSVSSNGGTPQVLIEALAGEVPHGPQMLPDGTSVLYTLARGAGPRWDDAEIVVHSLETDSSQVLIRGGSDGRYVPTGHIVYALESDLFAVPFDLTSLEVSETPVSIVQGMARTNAGQTGTGNFSFSDQGALVYVVGTGSATNEGVLALIDRDGVVERLNVPPADYRRPRVSPDGTQVVVTSEEDNRTRTFIWVYDLSGDTTIRQLEFDGRNGAALWTPDGEWITFASSRDAEQPDIANTLSIYRRRADGTGVAERLTTAEEGHQHFPESYSGDGRLSFSHAVGSATSVWTLSNEDGAEPEVFVDLPESNPLGSVFSPDGNWIAYHSDESGNRPEIYVQPFPPTGSKSQITQEGGRWLLWSPNGSQLLFRLNGQQLTVVDIETTPAVTSGNPQSIALANPRGFRNFDFMPNGERFVTVVPAVDGETEEEQAPPDQINIILNWFEELKERVPVP